KGPLVALLIRGSCVLLGPLSESLTGNLALAIRLPAVVCGVLLLASLYVLTVQALGRERLAFAVVALALTLPPVAAASTLMTIDAPYLACWGWALVFGHAAAVGGRRWAWPLAGLAVGVGILAKYTMALWLPSMALFLVMELGAGRARLLPSRERSRLGRSLALPAGFWLACAIAGVFTLPIAYWNARNDWVTVRHVGWQAGVEQRDGWRRLGPAVYVGEQAALLLGVWFVAWAGGVWAARPWRDPEPSRRYLWCLSLPTFAVFLAASLKTSGQVNWPAAAYLSGGVLAAGWLDERVRSPRPGVRKATRLAVAGAAALGLALTLVIHYPTTVARPLFVALAGPPTPDRPRPLRRVDPTFRLRGWRTLAAAVDEARAEVRAGGEEPVVVATIWTLPGVLGAYCDGHPTVYTIGLALGDRWSQYDLWRPNPVRDADAFRGRTFVLVGVPALAVYEAFDAVEPPRSVVYAEGDQPITDWCVTVARGYRGFGPPDRFLRSARH
ncbi:MAG TPA: glycosyltransferase family 39 protein, partial [Gemmataceae bacterium]